jgi:glycerophosphoryl diester phosphodiesterase
MPYPVTMRRPLLKFFALVLIALASVASACTASDPVQSAPADTGSLAAIGDEQELDVQGHRGARGLRPENTLPSFEVALDLEVTTLELDLHFTSDGQVVIWHDPEVGPIKCGLDSDASEGLPDPDDLLVAGEDLMIRGLSAADLGSYRCDRNPDAGRFPDQSADPTVLAGDRFSIVTLGALFEFVVAYSNSDTKTGEQRSVASRVQFNIETKRNPDEPATIGDGFDGVDAGPFELEVLRVVAEYGLENRVVIQSFDHRSLWAVRAVDPSIALAALSVGPIDLGDVAANGASIWSPSHNSVTPSLLRQAHNLGLLVIPWTVNESGDMQRLIGLGVDGLITDRPDIFVSVLTE